MMIYHLNVNLMKTILTKAKKRMFLFSQSYLHMCISTKIRPDIWFKVEIGAYDIPVLMVEIVSGSQGIPSLEQTIHKSICNTIDQLRLYMNLRISPITQMSSLVFPKHEGSSTGVTVVTVRFSPDSWKFCASFKNIQQFQVCSEMKDIVRQTSNFFCMVPHFQVLGIW